MAQKGIEIELVTEEQMMVTHMIEVLTEAGQLFEDDYVFKSQIKVKIAELVEKL